MVHQIILLTSISQTIVIPSNQKAREDFWIYHLDTLYSKGFKS